MDRNNHCEILRESGFADGEVQDLLKLRQDYAERATLQETIDQRRLEFARWLVANGRLSEQILPPTQNEDCSQDYAERATLQGAAEQRRLEFARWLVVNRRLADG